MNEQINDMKKGQKVRIVSEWFGTRIGDIFTLTTDEKNRRISLISDTNNEIYFMNLNYFPLWERVHKEKLKEFTDEEYESLLV